MKKKPRTRLTVKPECLTRQMIFDGTQEETLSLMAQAEANARDIERRLAEDEDAPFFYFPMTPDDE